MTKTTKERFFATLHSLADDIYALAEDALDEVFVAVDEFLHDLEGKENNGVPEDEPEPAAGVDSDNLKRMIFDIIADRSSKGRQHEVFTYYINQNKLPENDQDIEYVTKVWESIDDKFKRARG